MYSTLNSTLILSNLNCVLCWVVFTCVKALISLVDLVTTPFYSMCQCPWKRIHANQCVRTKRETANNPYSTYVRAAQDVCSKNSHIFKAETLAELQQLTVKLFAPKRRSLGYRRVIGVSQEVDPTTGKVFTKYDLAVEYKWLSVAQVDLMIERLAQAFAIHGVQYQEPVVIFAETKIEWFLCAQALLRIGSIVATLYATLGLEGIIFGINQTEVQHIVTTEDLLLNLLKILHKIPNIRKIYVIKVQHAGIEKVTQRDFDTLSLDRKVELISFGEMLELGRDREVAYTSPKPDDIALIQYTSGSTGSPKGVIQSHRNYIRELRSLYSQFVKQFNSQPQHCFYAYLPLAHALEMICELLFYSIGTRIGYGSAHTMTDHSTSVMKGQNGDLIILKPTLMVGVPLVFDRIRNSVLNRFKSNFSRQMLKYICAYKNYWLSLGYDTPLINELIGKKVQQQLGGNVEHMFIGGAPLSAETQSMMRALLNIKFYISYGCTETTGAVLSMDADDLSIGRVGAPLEGIKIRLIDWLEGGYSVRDRPNPRGELVVGGESVSKGYFKLPAQSKEAFEVMDSTNWFKTGDIVELFANGTIKIIDRKKDLVKLPFGEYVSLGKVESELKSFKYVDNVCVHADPNQLFTVAFISPNISALRDLSIQLKKPNAWTLKQLCNDQDIVERVCKEFGQFGLEAGLNKMEIPLRIKLCHEEWTVKEGHLTATMKINRRYIRHIYQTDIERMYS